ncbi:hypothetical protein [Prosthecobacter sp.]|uniref:hypothetical protein n=1 Tax=Prosthecobacter sp. TaxID=1965333 RepID=UPI002ABCCC64|nr:hypothetical protein [Prosthecobacter sp.]MDZ4405570.1 hypothetical protein [Prosthecobacter sp.]
MPYDPNLPPNNVQVKAQELRAQFNGLKDLIDAIQSITAAQVDAVTTVNPGDPAVVTLSVADGTLHISFQIPHGNDGSTGPPFTNFIVDGVTTLNPGEPATASASYDGTAVRLNFALPRGSDGTNGSNGTNGSDGGQGAPGEVSLQQLTAAIATTSSNSNNVATLGMPVSDPPTQSEVQQIANKMDELIVMLRR